MHLEKDPIPHDLNPCLDWPEPLNLCYHRRTHKIETNAAGSGNYHLDTGNLDQIAPTLKPYPVSNPMK